MYLRRNTVRSGDSRRTYVSIAHNVWQASATQRRRAESRPVILARLGREDDVDVTVAHDLTLTLDRWYRAGHVVQTQGHDGLLRVASEMRSAEPLLRALVASSLELSTHVQLSEQRIRVLTTLYAEYGNRPKLPIHNASLIADLRERISGG